jgi:adenine-specific DNA-methyltransferase
MGRKKSPNAKRPIESYKHQGKERLNNPPVGLVTPDTDPDAGQKKKTYAYDPHLDPQLVWAGKAEHTSFDVPTVSLHVHERIDPRTIIEAVRKRNGNGQPVQGSLFEEERKEPLREAIEFYRHKHGWTNRLIAGDSLLVMNSLLEKEGMAGKVQMVYIDPPYGIRYGSNFQPFVNKRDVKDGKDEDLTSEPEQIRAFRDTWELGIHSYLTYLRDRLLLARELLSESGSIFVQIGDENVQHVRALMDEVFGMANFMSLISFRTKIPLNAAFLPNIADYLIWYAKDKAKVKFRRLFVPREIGADSQFTYIEEKNGATRSMTREELENPKLLPSGGRPYRLTDLSASGHTDSCHFEFELDGRKYYPPGLNSWKTTPAGMEKLIAAGRVRAQGKVPSYVFFADDYPVMQITNQWTDTQGASGKVYAVQTATKVVERCMMMTTDPGDLVFDPTCGSGTTACVAEQWGRRWITCDTSRVAITLARQRLMTAVFDYYELAHPEEGVGSGFKYKTVPHVTLKSIANNPDIREGMTREEIDAAIARHAPQETLYHQPFVDRKKVRVTGPFTVEAVPAPTVKSVEELLEGAPQVADASIARSGETLRQGEWRDELLRAGIRGKSGQYIRFARLEPLPGCRWLHADGETRPNDEGADQVREKGAAYAAQRIVVSFGPEHAPLEQRQVAQAIEEAQTLVPKPKLIVFAAFQFDPEAARDIDETQWPGVTLLKAQMNADLLTEDLKKKRASNESFWLIGQPDVRVEKIAKGEEKGKFVVSVHGFDYYNTKTGGIESGGEDKIAVWLLDTDYDGRSLYPRQVFFPMAGEKEGWTRLAKNLKAEIDEERIDAYRGTVSLPFEPGQHKRIAVKIVDDRGIESLKVMELLE